MVAIKKQLFLYKVQNKNIMATFTELQCFNKLLLQKIKRMEERHEREMLERNSKIFNSYDSLYELVTSAEYGIRSCYLQCCDLCHVWYNIDVDDDLICICEDGNEYVCKECFSEPTCSYKRCCECNGLVNYEYKFAPFNILKKNNEEYCCYKCYRTNLAKTINGTPFNSEFIRRHVYNSRRVIKELGGAIVRTTPYDDDEF